MKISQEEMRQIIKEEAVKLMLEDEKNAILIEMHGIERMMHAKVSPKMRNVIERNAQAIASKISPEQAKVAVKELATVGLLGVSKQAIEHKLKDILHINESVTNEAWNKSKVHNWLLGSGLGANTAALVAAILGKLPEKVGADSAVLMGLIAIAIEAITSNIAASPL